MTVLVAAAVIVTVVAVRVATLVHPLAATYHDGLGRLQTWQCVFTTSVADSGLPAWYITGYHGVNDAASESVREVL